MNLKTAKYLLVALLPLAGQIFHPVSASADAYASEQRKNAALGHYARARTMLVEALAEFEQARKYAWPDMLIDSEEWRLSIISRTEELNRVLDPKPRVTRDGVRFKANTLLIRREKERTPRPEEGAKDNNLAGEESRQSERREARARMEIPEDEAEPVKVIPKEEKIAPSKSAKKAQQDLSFPSVAPEEQAPAPVVDAPAEPLVGEPVKADEVAPPAKLIEDEEEVVSSKPAEAPAPARKPLISDEDESSAGKSQSVEEKENEVTRQIEQEILDRIEREKAAPDQAADVDDETGE